VIENLMITESPAKFWRRPNLISHGSGSPGLENFPTPVFYAGGPHMVDLLALY
jgi:hypothetical protein